MGILLYRRYIFPPSLRATRAVSCCRLELPSSLARMSRRCALYRLTERVEKYTGGAGPWSMCVPTLSNPLRVVGPHEVMHTTVHRIALAACSRAMDVISVSSGASGQEQAAMYYRVHLDAYASALPGGIASEARGRKIRPRAEGTPEPPPTASRPRIVRATAMLRAPLGLLQRFQ